MKTLFLHVGAGKTGSTAVQHHLFNNAAALRQRGVAVPLLDIYYPGRNSHDYMGNGEFLVAELVEGKVGAHRDIYARFLDECRATSQPCTIVSCEMLEFANTAGLEALKEDLHRTEMGVKVIYILRDIIPHAVSFWLQVVKNHGETRTWEEYAKDFHSPFAPSLSKFQKVFGSDDVLTAKYDEGNPSAVLPTFYGLIGVPMDGLAPVALTHNRSLGAAASQAALVVNEQLYLSPDEKRALIRNIHSVLLFRGLDPRFVGTLTGDMRRKFEQAHESDVRMLMAYGVDWGWPDAPSDDREDLTERAQR